MNNKLIFTKLSILLFIFVSSCDNHVGSTGKNPLQEQRDKIIQGYFDNNAEPAVHLGYGIDDRTGIVANGGGRVNNCLVNENEPNNIIDSNPIAYLNFSNSIDSDTLSAALNTSISGKASFGMFSGSLNASYARAVADTRESLHFHYLQTMSEDVSYKIPTVGNNVLNKDAQDLLKQGMQSFTNVCGNSFVKAAKRGAVLLVDVSIEFNNAEDKMKFAAGMNAKAMSIGQVGIAFSNEKDSTTKNASFVMRALQLGGDGSGLADIFVPPDKDGNYPIKKCETDFSTCSNVINQVINYAQNKFPNSVDFNKESTIYTFNYATMKYKDLGIQAILPKFSDKIKDAVQYLTTTLDHDNKMYNYLKAYKAQWFYNSIDTGTKKDMEQAVQTYEYIINDTIKNHKVLYSCYGNLDDTEAKCLQARQEVEDLHKKAKESIDFAENMANTIVINDKHVGCNRVENASPVICNQVDYIYLPVSNDVTCNYFIDQSTECYGHFIKINLLNYFNIPSYSIPYEKRLALFDTTKDNSFFKNNYPQYKGKIFQIIAYMDSFTPKRGIIVSDIAEYVQITPIKDLNTIALSLYKTKLNVNNEGWNAKLLYSNSSDFLYNPI